MIKNFVLVVILLTVTSGARSDWPPCDPKRSFAQWTDCYGIYLHPNSDHPNHVGLKAYKGWFKDGRFNGEGIAVYSQGRYVGEFKDDKRHGRGTFTFTDGSPRLEGNFLNGAFVGRERTLEPITRVDNSTPESSIAPNLDSAKTKCAELGFKPGTEKFGQCVMRLLK